MFKEKKNILIVAVEFFLVWLLSYLATIGKIDISFQPIIENASLLLIGIIICLILCFSKDTSNIIPILIFVPFMFARGFDIYTFPKAIFGACGLAVIGIIVNLIRFKVKLKMGSLFIGLCVLGTSMVLGGIITGKEYVLYQTVIMLFIVLMFILIYTYLISTSKKQSFENICFLLTTVGMLLVAQSITFYLLNDDTVGALKVKDLFVGWGISNNIALMLLFTIPFTVYLMYNEKKRKICIYSLCAFLQMAVIIISYCRGGIFALVFELIAIIVFTFFRNKRNKKIRTTTIYIAIIYVAVIVLGLTFLYLRRPDLLEAIRKNVLDFNLDTLNGRDKVYKASLDAFKESPIFGLGILFPFFMEDKVLKGYMWGHSTLLQTLSTMGLVGLGCLIYHMVDKYYKVIKNINFKRLTLLFAFMFSGLYGLFDVSYYFINYMVVLIIVFILTDSYMYKKNEPVAKLFDSEEC